MLPELQNNSSTISPHGCGHLRHYFVSENDEDYFVTDL